MQEFKIVLIYECEVQNQLGIFQSSLRWAAGGRSSRWSPTTPCGRWRRPIKTDPPSVQVTIERRTDANDLDMSEEGLIALPPLALLWLQKPFAARRVIRPALPAQCTSIACGFGDKMIQQIIEHNV